MRKAAWAGLMASVSLAGCASHQPKTGELGTPASPTPAASADSDLTGSNEGRIDSGQLESAMSARRDDFNACYKKSFGQGIPYRSGEVQTRFLIGPDGRATQAAVVRSTLEMPAVGSCILEVIRSIEFPVPQNGSSVKVEYPFRFGKARVKEVR